MGIIITGNVIILRIVIEGLIVGVIILSKALTLPCPQQREGLEVIGDPRRACDFSSCMQQARAQHELSLKHIPEPTRPY